MAARLHREEEEENEDDEELELDDDSDDEEGLDDDDDDFLEGPQPHPFAKLLIMALGLLASGYLVYKFALSIKQFDYITCYFLPPPACPQDHEEVSVMKTLDFATSVFLHLLGPCMSLLSFLLYILMLFVDIPRLKRVARLHVYSIFSLFYMTIDRAILFAVTVDSISSSKSVQFRHRTYAYQDEAIENEYRRTVEGNLWQTLIWSGAESLMVFYLMLNAFLCFAMTSYQTMLQKHRARLRRDRNAAAREMAA